MNDLTILYYTANRISEHFAQQVRARLMVSIRHAFCQRAHHEGVTPALHPDEMPPVIVISHQPMADLFCNARYICVGDKPPSIWQVYQNVLAGAKAATTPYVACCEDDTLYAPAHFNHRPPLDTFAYNHMRYVITRRATADGKGREAFYYFRQRTQMAMCIAPREQLIATLEERFAKYPTPVAHDVAKKTGWGEPGRYEKNLGITEQKIEYFRSAMPNITFNHGESLMGRRAVQDTDVIAQSLDGWGDANELWNNVHG